MPENARGSDPQTDPVTGATIAQRTALRQGDTGRSQAEISLHASAMAHRGWGMCEDRTARSAPGRAKFEARFLEQAGGDPVRAASLRTAYYKDLARQSVAARRRSREALQDGAA